MPRSVTAGAEYHDKPAGRGGPQRVERLGERVGLVRVVDEDRRAAAGPDQLKPALGADQVFERREYLGGIGAGRDGEASCNQCIFDLKFADQRQAHAEVFSAMFNPQHLREAVDDGFGEADTRTLTSDADDRETARFGGGHDSFGVLVVGIDDRAAARLD